MINDKNALPVLTKEQIAELGKGLSEDFTESLDRAERLFKKPPIGLKPKFIHRKERINDILDAMERYAKAECLILPEWVDEFPFIVTRETWDISSVKTEDGYEQTKFGFNTRKD